MNIFLKLILYIAGLILFLYITTSILNFTGLSLSTYGSYLLWMSAIFIFFIILPGKGKTIFLE
jgi:hypothetical protein